MASSQEFLDYVLDLLSGVDGLTHRKMMGEYLLYANGVLFGGIYDDRLLVKETPSSTATLERQEIPYEGAKKPMRLVDVEDADVLAELVKQMCAELA